MMFHRFGDKLCTLYFEKEHRLFSKKTQKNISYTDSFCYRCRRVLCTLAAGTRFASLSKKARFPLLKENVTFLTPDLLALFGEVFFHQLDE
jgi:hypothetical protein